ncbi:MAG TPA: DNA-3-methyladenine glycosylase 2 family protein [Streptosporangiaceae bacterium]
MTAISSQTVPLERQWRAPFAVDVLGVLAVHRRGRGDPAFAVDDAGGIWRVSRTPDGPGTLCVAWRVVRDPGSVTLVDAAAWGPGAGWLLDLLPSLLGADDRPEEFAPEHPVLREAVRRYPAVRIGRSGLVFEALVPAVLEQKVVGAEAKRAWRILLRRFGEPAPGPAPAGLRVPLSPAAWASVPSWEWHKAGVEAVRARTIVTAARVAGRMEEAAGMAPDDADRRLRTLPGIGPWTSAEIRQRACGDPDAVSVGDYHLPAIVGWALAGHEVDDAGMLELLAPYRGHRHRAAMMASLSGTRPPRRAPRMSIRDYRAF